MTRWRIDWRWFLALGVSVAVNLVSIALTFAIRLMVARVAGAAAFGTFAVWHNNVLGFGTAGGFGQHNYIIRLLTARDNLQEGERDIIALSAVRLSVIGAAFFAFVAAVLLVGFQGGSWTQAWWQAAAIFALALMVTLGAVHRGLGAITLGIAFNRLVYPLLFILGLLVLAGRDLDAQWPIMLCSAAMLTALLASAACFARRIAINRRTLANLVPVRRLAKEALPYFLLALALAVNGRYLLALFGVFADGEQLGQLALAATLAAIVAIPEATLNLILGPHLARQLAQSGQGARSVLAFLGAVLVTTLACSLLVYWGHRPALELAGIKAGLAPRVLGLMIGSVALMALTNAVLLIEQYRGHAGAASRQFCAVVAVKLIAGLCAGASFSLAALIWVDIIVTSVFLFSFGLRACRLITMGRRA